MEILKTITNYNQKLNAQDSLPATSAGKLNEAIQAALRIAKHDYLVVLISDGNGANDESVRLITSLSEHNDVISLFIHDPLEAQLPNVGKLIMSEAELQLEVDTSGAKLRKGYQQEFAERLEWLRETSRLRSIPLLPIVTSESVAEQVRRLLGHVPGR